MYQINSENKFLLNSIISILNQKNFPILQLEKQNSYGSIDIISNENCIIIKFEDKKIKLSLPFGINHLWKSLQLLTSDSQVNFGNLSYFPTQEMLCFKDKTVKLTYTHNTIVRAILLNKGLPIKKKDLYYLIWPSDVDVYINKLDTHLTNLKNLLFVNFKFEFSFSSQEGFITFLVN